jgi:hypothetical protein
MALLPEVGQSIRTENNLTEWKTNCPRIISGEDAESALKILDLNKTRAEK